MGDVMGLMLERYSCDVQIRALTSQIGKWEEEADSLAGFRRAVMEAENELDGSVQAALGAVQELEGISGKCLTADIYGERMTEELQQTGQVLAPAAFARLEERIERELASYSRKMEEGRRDLAVAAEKRALIEEQIRMIQEDEP